MSNPRNGSEGGRFRISARSAAYLQVACSLLMLFPLLGYGLFSEWQLALKEQRERISHTISVMAARQAALTRSTESLLLALSLSPEVEDGDPLALSSFHVSPPGRGIMSALRCSVLTGTASPASLTARRILYRKRPYVPAIIFRRRRPEDGFPSVKLFL